MLRSADRRDRTVPGLVWLVVLLQSALMFAMMFLYPAFQEPDEIAHVDYVQSYRHGHWIYGPGERLYQDGVARADLDLQERNGAPVGDHVIPTRGARKSFDQRGTGIGNVTKFPNQMVQHPPLYYATAALFSEIVPFYSHLHSDVQVFWLRLLSVLLLAPVPILAFLIGRRLTGDDRVGLIASLLPLTMPTYLRTGASVTNDSMAILFGAALIYALSRVMTGDLSRRTAAWTGLIWAGGLLTKGLALALIPFIALAYLVGASGPLRDRIRTAWLPALVCGGVGAVAGGWWWVHNEIAYGAVQPSGYGPTYGAVNYLYGPDRPGGNDPKLVTWIARLYSDRMWGSLGLIDNPHMATWIPTLVMLAVVALIVVGTLIGLRRTTAPRGAALTMIVPVALTLLVLYVGVRHVYLRTQMLPGLQARYLSPVLFGVFVCAALGLRRLSGRAFRWVPLGLVGFALVFNAAAAVVVLNRTYASRNLHGVWQQVKHGLRVVARWSPWAPPVSATLAALVVLAVLAVLAGFGYSAWRTPWAAVPDGPGAPQSGPGTAADRVESTSADPVR